MHADKQAYLHTYMFSSWEYQILWMMYLGYIVKLFAGDMFDTIP